jgi:hypothetical protein
MGRHHLCSSRELNFGELFLNAPTVKYIEINFQTCIVRVIIYVYINCMCVCVCVCVCVSSGVLAHGPFYWSHVHLVLKSQFHSFIQLRVRALWKVHHWTLTWDSCMSVTVEARVRFQASSCGICGRQSATGQVFLLVLPLSPGNIFLPMLSTHISFLHCGCYIILSVDSVIK